jgi:hypothetical protein
MKGVQKARPTHNKRQREQKLIQKRKDKEERRREAAAGRPQRTAGGEDPDLAGIKPGPQPSPWADMMPDADLPTDDEDEDGVA